MASSSQEQIQCLPAGYNLNAPLLHTWYLSMSENARQTFKSYFGYLSSALLIEPREELLWALIRFWDPSTSVFRFGGRHEMTPLIEEYNRLLGMDHGCSDIIVPKFSRNFKRKLCNFLGLKRTLVESYLNIDQGTCSISFLINAFSTYAGFNMCQESGYITEELWWGRRPWVLGLCLVSLILFPRADGDVDLRLIDVVVAIQEQKAIVPMVLAETYRSLNRCKVGRSMFFSGAAVLLQVWALEHISPSPIIFHCWFDDDLFEKSNKGTIETLPTDSHTWIQYLNGVAWDELHWFSGWANNHSAVLRCPEFPFLPLIGLNGIVPYAPSRVIRQFGWKQIIPQVQDMSMFLFDYAENAEPKCLDNALTLWNNQEVYRCPEEDRDYIDNTVSYEYDTWLESTLSGNPLLETVSLMGCAPPSGDGYVDYVAEMSAKHKKLTAAYLNDEEHMKQEICHLESQVQVSQFKVIEKTAELDRANALIDFVEYSLNQMREADEGNSAKSLKMYRQWIDGVLEEVRAYKAP